MDRRVCYTMETGYTRSDFSFYKTRPDTMEVGYPEIADLQSRAGREKWYLVDTYTHYWKSGHGSDYVLVLTNDNGVQIETAAFGWKRVTTEHELALREKRRYHDFIDALAALEAPAGLRRWHSEVIEMFEHTYEEILYYGDE